ncbi:MAG: Uncharacterised protein [Flavobacteriaceae bacterium]|nr:MAG: Uncharacterised protein [Flavobacteriaceae bacterium]
MTPKHNGFDEGIFILKSRLKEIGIQIRSRPIDIPIRGYLGQPPGDFKVVVQQARGEHQSVFEGIKTPNGVGNFRKGIFRNSIR